MKKQLLVFFLLFPFLTFSQSVNNATYRFLDLNNSAQTSAMGGVNISIASPANIFENQIIN